MTIKNYKIALGAMLAVGVAGVTGPATAKVDGDTIILGSAISLTGKYATNGLHTQRGYDYAVKVINEAGGVTVGGKSYKLTINYYDDESTPARAAQLVERLIQQDGVDYMLGPLCVRRAHARRAHGPPTARTPPPRSKTVKRTLELLEASVNGGA